MLFLIIWYGIIQVAPRFKCITFVPSVFSKTIIGQNILKITQRITLQKLIYRSVLIELIINNYQTVK